LRHSTDRILVSHAGNLPRPDSLNELIDGGLNRDGANSSEYAKRLPKAVEWIVDQQIEYGVDIVNDGEYAKAGSYGGYIHDRITGYSMVEVDPNRAPAATRVLATIRARRTTKQARTPSKNRDDRKLSRNPDPRTRHEPR